MKTCYIFSGLLILLPQILVCSTSTIHETKWRRPSFTTINKAFRNYTFAVFRTRGMFQCSSFCSNDVRCYSFNYGPRDVENNCELNDRLSDSYGQWLVNAPGFRYFEMRSIQPNRLEPYQGAECVDAAVDLPSEKLTPLYLTIGRGYFGKTLFANGVSSPKPVELELRGFSGQVDAMEVYPPPGQPSMSIIFQEGVVYKHTVAGPKPFPLEAGYPKPVSEEFGSEIPTRPDFVLTGITWEELVIAKNGTVYTYNLTSREVTGVEEWEISAFRNVPDSVTAASSIHNLPTGVCALFVCYPNEQYIVRMTDGFTISP